MADLLGKSLLERVYLAAKSCPFEELWVAVDSQEIFDLARSFGANAVMTSKTAKSGTDRIGEVVKRLDIKQKIIVNWQCDEPFIHKKMIEDLLSGEGDVWTLKKKIEDQKEILSPHTVKVVTDLKGNALYFSRSPIPHHADTYYKHIGLYAYRADVLAQITTWAPTPLEKTESLEQLRFLENGLVIRVNKTKFESIGIDTIEDLKRAQKRLVDNLQ